MGQNAPTVSLTISILAAIGAALLTTLSTMFVNHRKMAREFRLQFQAETIARKLLLHRKWRLRSFRIIQHHLGGFDDDELRKILVQCGALRFQDSEGREIWGLMERNRDLLDDRGGQTAAN